MALRLYDSSARQVRDFVPLVDGRVGVYVCGPTPQSAPHIGHVRAQVAFDVLRRWLTHRGLEVTYVRNVTDIDDKILVKSQAEGREWWAHAFLYERRFVAAYDALNVLPPTIEPRATGHIIEMVELVEALIARGHAYPAPDGSGDVYFDVRSWPDYGELTRQGLDDMEAAADADPNARKRDPRDFALWKGSKPAEPLTASWPTPWGRGRPGWHLECSAMATRYLGDEFDIHGGGLDLRFPHHENEVAQSRAAGSRFARYWLHNAWVVTAGEKMSKSVGNTMTIESLLTRVRPVVLRYLLAAPHYRSNIEVGDESLTEASAAYERIEGFVLRAVQRLDDDGHTAGTAGAGTAGTGTAGAGTAGIGTAGAGTAGTGTAGTGTAGSGTAGTGTSQTGTAGAGVPQAFADALDDDLGVPAAIAVLHDTVREGNRALTDGDDDAVRAALVAVRAMAAVLGIDPLDPHWSDGSGDDRLREALDVLVRAELDARAQARKGRDFAAADAIRDRLAAAGIVVEDTPDGARWTLPGNAS